MDATAAAAQSLDAELRRWAVMFVAICVLLSAWSLLRVQQGLYEDHVQMNELHGARPPILAARGLARASLWWQAHYQPSPVGIRAWNLWLGVLIALAVGLLASQLELTAWPAIGVMLLHPLRIETIALMSGRYELVAALGVVGACACVAGQRVTVWHLSGAGLCLALGWLGKETALVGLVLVPLTMAVRFRRFSGVWCVAAFGALLTASLSAQHLGWTAAIQQPYTAWTWLLVQGAAGWRELTLLVVPLGQTIDYDYDGVAMALRVAALVGLSLYALCLVLLWSTQRPLAYAMAWPALVLVPRLIVQTPKSYLNDHQMFMGLVGVALTVAWLHRTAEARCASV